MFSWYRIPTLFAHEIFSPFGSARKNRRKRNPIWFAPLRVARFSSNILWFPSSSPEHPSSDINHMKKSYNFNVIISEGEMNNVHSTWVEHRISFSAVSICLHYLFNFIQFSSSPDLRRDFLGWAVLLNFLVYITIPVVLQYTGILLGIGSFAIYVKTIIGLAKKENYFWEQVQAWRIQFVFALRATKVWMLFFASKYRQGFNQCSL